MNKVVMPQPTQLRNVETFISDYKKVSLEDLSDVDRKTYADFYKEFKDNPVEVMVRASDFGMDLEQYGNLVAPDTMVEQNRSIMHRIQEDEGIYVAETSMSAPSTVGQCLDGGHKQAILFHILTRAWEKKSIKDRSSITLQTSSPTYQYPNQVTTSTPPAVAVGLRLNPGELVATSHSINTNSYAPFKWDYDEDDMKRTSVKPAETIPASTLGESEGNIPMQKWGNRFVLPYEMLTGGQGMRINKLAQMVMLDAATESVRMYEELLGVLEKGDGARTVSSSDPTAAKISKISDFGGTKNTFGFVPFLNWIDEAMAEPFQISHVIMLTAQLRQLRTVVAALDTQMAFQHLQSVGLAPSGVTNMETQGGIRYGRAPDGALTTGYVLGVDARYAVEKVNRAGMTIRQQAENIANQTRDVVISDTYLWARLSNEAVVALNIGA